MGLDQCAAARSKPRITENGTIVKVGVAAITYRWECKHI